MAYDRSIVIKIKINNPFDVKYCVLGLFTYNNIYNYVYNDSINS